MVIKRRDVRNATDLYGYNGKILCCVRFTTKERKRKKDKTSETLKMSRINALQARGSRVRSWCWTRTQGHCIRLVPPLVGLKEAAPQDTCMVRAGRMNEGESKKEHTGTSHSSTNSCYCPRIQSKVRVQIVWRCPGSHAPVPRVTADFPYTPWAPVIAHRHPEGLSAVWQQPSNPASLCRDTSPRPRSWR